VAEVRWSEFFETNPLVLRPSHFHTGIGGVWFPENMRALLHSQGTEAEKQN